MTQELKDHTPMNEARLYAAEAMADFLDHEPSAPLAFARHRATEAAYRAIVPKNARIEQLEAEIEALREGLVEIEHSESIEIARRIARALLRGQGK